MVVTSAVIPIPLEWMSIPRVRVTVSVDGLPEHHDVRRKPATYDRILKNIAGCQVNMHGTITRPMLERPGYLEEYISFWNARPEVVRICDDDDGKIATDATIVLSKDGKTTTVNYTDCFAREARKGSGNERIQLSFHEFFCVAGVVVFLVTI